MILLYVALFVIAYAVGGESGRAARWRASPVALASGALLFVVVAAVFLGRHYAVPRLPRLLLYALAFTESVVLVPTVLLSFQRMAGLASAGALRAALLGACIGLLCGYAIGVFGLGVW